MLILTVLGDELFDEEKEEFLSINDVRLELEHSLVSLSKWESEFQKPFLGSQEKTPFEIISYIRCMILTPNVTEEVLGNLSQANLEQINKYIESSESATTFGEMPERKGKGEIITSELIYYWMVAFTIPFECQNWHLNRLFALIRICNIKNNPKQKKMSRHEVATRNRALNAQRREQMGTNG